MQWFVIIESDLNYRENSIGCKLKEKNVYLSEIKILASRFLSKVEIFNYKCYFSFWDISFKLRLIVRC